VDCLLHQDLASHVVLLFVMVVLSWAWIQCVSLLGKWSVNLIFPKLFSLSGRHEVVFSHSGSSGLYRLTVTR
jgi:hypothetical protein